MKKLRLKWRRVYVGAEAALALREAYDMDRAQAEGSITIVNPFFGSRLLEHRYGVTFLPWCNRVIMWATDRSKLVIFDVLEAA